MVTYTCIGITIKTHSTHIPHPRFRIDQFMDPPSSAGAHLILSKPDNLSKPNPPNISKYIVDN